MFLIPLRCRFLLFFSGIFLLLTPLFSQTPSTSERVSLAHVDRVINSAIEDRTIPGAVLLVIKNDSIRINKAYGSKSLVPQKEFMTKETIFDLASLTKPIVTSSAVMLLLEQGRLRLLDPVSMFFPGFKQGRKENPIRLIHLLTHTSGLPPYAHPKMLFNRYGAVSDSILFEHIQSVERHSAPAEKFVYSCLNFVTLQRIVEKVSGLALDTFARKNLFDPLNMNKTGYKPDSSQLAVCAPTEIIDNETMLGIVHDPIAREAMDCVSGNAGLFSNAEDLARFSRMMLHKGRTENGRLFSTATVEAFTTIPEGYEKFGRALGWDVSSAYASNQGDLLSDAAYGHTGYTGTSLVIDPQNNLAIILLTNRVHPDDKGSVVRLRSLVANTVTAALLR